MAGKLWNLTYVVQAGRYFVWRLLRLSGFHDASAKLTQTRTVEIGGEFHADLLFKMWVIDHALLLEGEALSAPCYTAIKRPAKKHSLSDARFEAAGRFCVEKENILEIRLAD